MSTRMDDESQIPVKLSLPLAFQQELFHEVRHEDRLTILARGLGLLRIVTNLLHSYDAAGDNLIVVVGADDRENEWIGEAMAEQAAVSGSVNARGLTIVRTETQTVGTRQKLYSKGGTFSITSRILIVDLLTNLLNPATITGLVVLHSERVVATSVEAFILREFRQKNKNGFIKAFSDNPEPFTSGFAPLASMMRNLFLRTPTLWPRFHVTVAESLESKKSEVIELSVNMTDSMHEIQTAIMQCIEISISELRKGNSRELDMEDWTIESALHRSFDISVRRQLDPVWHRVSWKTRQIVSDLTVLRNMLNCLLAYDCVAFQQYLETILAAHSPPPNSTRQSQSPWLFLDAAQVIFSLAKRRVYTGKVNAASTELGTIPQGLHPVLEEQPKWAMLSEILDEIEHDVHFNPAELDTSNGTTLIMCSDQGTCRQIREYLQATQVHADESDEEDRPGSSAASMMRRKLRGYLAWKRDFVKAKAMLFSDNMSFKSTSSAPEAQKRRPEPFRGRAPPNKRRRVRGGNAAAAGASRNSSMSVQIPEDEPSHVAELLADVQPNEDEQQLKPEVVIDPLDNIEDYYELMDLRNIVVVHPYDGDMDDRILEELRPRHIILYNPDNAFARRVEVYRSSHTDRSVKIYFVYYGDSVEEQRFLSAVRKEKDAFSKLIKEKATMSVTLTTAGKEVDDPQEQFLRTVNTRIAGGGRLVATSEPPRVVVDVREFRSSLPSLLHGKHTVVVPCMLTVGDYILSPDICVERKSVKDLISSFKDGRLYSQCESMTQYYKHVMILIEFEQNKSFNLEPFAEMNSSIGQTDLQSKLVLLTLAFPQVKLIWSSSPYQTAEIFEELKKNQEEPNPVKAVKIGLAEGEDPLTAYNQTPQDMLRAIPGVTSKNYKYLMSDVENIVELSNMDEKEISDLIGKEAGRQVCKFFNKSVFE